MTLSWIASFLRKRTHESDEESDYKRSKPEIEVQAEPNPNAIKEYDTSFIKRPLLELPGNDNGDSGSGIKIMTYNVLAQALINRNLFPDSGDSLKWKNRSKVFVNEISHYNPDIICLQEVDTHKVKDFWTKELGKLNMDANFTTTGNKSHGQIIAYRRSRFELVGDVQLIEFDKFKTKVLPTQYRGDNTAMLVTLKDIETSKEIVVGSCHLFWHPRGTYERARQMQIFLEEATKYRQNENAPIFLCGDFNSRTFDTSYLSSTCQDLDKEAIKTLKESILTTNFATPPNKCQELPESLDLNEDQTKLVKTLRREYEKLPWKCCSLYSAYRKVHPNNVDEYGEPLYSNWAHGWRGLLDYIFTVVPKNTVVDTYQRSGTIKGPETTIRVSHLLRLPQADEMGPDPDNGQPQEGKYPSDHFALMAVVYVD